jgi:hypothetical protein
VRTGHGALYETGDIVEVGCWAHCRRRFFEFAKAQSKPGLAAQALQWIASLYAIESRIRNQTPDLKYAARQIDALPVLAQFRQWLEGNVIGLPAQEPLAKAFGYALRHWPALVRYTESGILLPDNNALERQIRPIALGRANWTFAGSPRGARAAATMYSYSHGSAERLRACMAQGYTSQVAVVSCQSRARTFAARPLNE